MSDYTKKYLEEAVAVINNIDVSTVDKMVEMLVQLRKDNGRLFFLGVGGGAANASHAVNDFRKIAGIESYSPGDNVSELTARINDNGWSSVFKDWLKISRIGSNDGVFVFSVGGGNEEKNVSVNIVEALKLAKECGAKVFGIVGRDGGFTAKIADACIVIPTISQDTVTPHTEAFQGVIWHLIVSHPEMNIHGMKWESLK